MSCERIEMKVTLGALFAGILFGAGLAISQMTNPYKVLNFLDVSGSWDPSLIFVLGGAVVVTGLSFRLVLRRKAPLFDSRFYLPTRSELDRPLLLGAAIFGIGWGLAGFCPGPALASLASASGQAVLFVVAMIAGSLSYRTVSGRN